LRRAPGFTTVVLLTLALGVGANAAIFSVLDAVLYRPLPVPEARRVVNLAWDDPPYLQSGLSPVQFQYWHEHARTLDAMATWQPFLARVDDGGEVSSVRALRVSREFLHVLGWTPALGRDFAAAEYVPDDPSVALVSGAMWQARFGGTVDAVGRTLVLDEEPLSVVGVLPASFAFPYVPEPVDVIVPFALSVDPSDQRRNWHAIARLRDGSTHEEAQAEVASLTGPFRAAYPNHVYEGERGMRLATFGELYAGDAARPLWILMGAVGVVLLIACANVANLFLARAARRRGEVALRAALGATRGRIARLVLTESVLVALAAGALALPLARWGAAVLVSLTPSEVPRLAAAGIDGRVMLFTFAASLVTGLAFGSAAAWPAARTPLSKVLEQSARGVAAGRGRQGLIVAQSALSMVLLVGAALLLVTLIGLRRVDPGFDPEGLVAVRLPSRPMSYETSGDLAELQRRVLEQMRDAPAVASVAGASNLPLERGINTRVSIGGRLEDPGTVEWRAVTSGYFRTLDIAVLAGRPFTDMDSEGGVPVAIVNEAFARRFFSRDSPIGRRVVEIYAGELTEPSPAGPGPRIIGLVADIREVSLRTAPRPTVYVPQPQASTNLSSIMGTMPVFIARSRSSLGDVERAFRDALRLADPALPRPEVLPLEDVVAASLARERLGAALLSLLAALALALTAFGVYGVLAYAVRQRRREIGIRMALGAGGRQVTRMVMAQGIAPVLLGLLLGVPVSLALSRVVTGFLWGVEPTDSATLATVAAILLGTAIVASWIPAREAVALDPADTLKSE
jgi:predicted permease